MTQIDEPNLDSIINLFISKINANEQTSNYIFDEDYVAVAELKRDFEGYIANQVAKAIEGALDQVGVFVLGGTVRLNDIYGNDYRNNYGYNETQVRDAANWIQDRQRVKLETLRATLNGVKKRLNLQTPIKLVKIS